MNKRIFPILTAALLLTGCAQTAEAPVITETSAVTAVSSTETTTSTTTGTTSTTKQTTTTTETTTTEAPTEPVVLTGLDTLEVYQSIAQKDFVTEANVTLTDPTALVNTGGVGEYDITVPWERDGVTGETVLHYTVKDTTPPVVLNAGREPYVQVGTAFDLSAIVGYGDNCDPHPVLTYAGNVDTNVIGGYPITATVTDSAGNATNWELTVQVVESIPKSSNNGPRTDFADFMAQHPAEGARYGIDVSKWQGDIDFNAVRDAGCSFVLMRIGYGGSEIKMDDWYQPNYQKAREAGLDVGIYFYSTANNTEDARYQADWMAAQLGGDALQLPVAFDWESFSRFQQYGMSLHDLNDVYEVFAEEMAAQGYETMLYSSRDPLYTVWENRMNRPVWLAHYTAQTNYEGSYLLWQQSNTGRIAGIAGDVDLNIWYTGQ